MGEGKPERAIEPCGPLQDLFAFGNDLGANAISGDDGDSVLLHGHLRSAGLLIVSQWLNHAAYSIIPALARARD